jgi:hypothetical protein
MPQTWRWLAPAVTSALLLALAGCECDRCTATAHKSCNGCEKRPCSGCGHTKKVETAVAPAPPSDECDRTAPVALKSEFSGDLPQNPHPGDCYVRVFLPPETKECTKRVMVKEASERLEITPAEYEWVEETVCVKDASKHLEEVPAQFSTREQCLQTKQGYAGWEMNTDADCMLEGNAADNKTAFCYVSHPAETKDVTVQTLDQPATVRAIEEPAQFQTVRRQKLVHPAMARRVEIPAQYQDISETVVVSAGQFEWKRAVCEHNVNADVINQVKDQLAVAGYHPGPRDGQMNSAFWDALRQYQKDNRLGNGALTYETVQKLGVYVP